MLKDEHYYQVQLALSEHVGPITYRDLLRYYSSAKEAVARLPEIAARGGRKRPIKVASDTYVEEQLERAEAQNIQIITSETPQYPRLLKEIEDRPPLLFVKGRLSLLGQKSVGIVGSRNSSINGQNLARKIAFDLVHNKYCVVSGMARGIDAAAHTGALADAGETAGTIAVLGTGVDEIYPRENEQIYHELSEHGCLVSELPLGTKPLPAFFPRRNRIISGLSIGVVVIEASKMSGSLITARCALEQNREVFAVPGSPLDPRSEGPNRLIQEGAHLATNAQDIMRTLDFDTTKMLLDSEREQETFFPIETLSAKDLKQARTLITERLSPEAVSVNQLIRETGLPTAVVNIILVELELAGRIERFAGGRVSLTYSNEWGDE